MLDASTIGILYLFGNDEMDTKIYHFLKIFIKNTANMK